MSLSATHYQGAINDFKMYLHINTRFDDHEDLCEVHGNLAISFYLLRKYDMTKKCLRTYYKYKVKLPQEAFRNSKLEKINKHIINFESELDDFDNVSAKCDDGLPQSVPFQGFNNEEGIRQMSSACYYINPRKKSKVSGVFVKADMPKASVILLEKPLSTNVNAPFVQCELCLRISVQVYTCLECRYKTYCSLECIKNDKDFHQYECSAYRNLIILILDAKDLYRLFLQLSNHLHEYVFTQKVFRKFSTAAAVLDKIERDIDQCESHFASMFALLHARPNYDKLGQMQYSTLVTTAFRLTIFISKKTNIIDTFYKKLRIAQTQKIILIGVILMRLHCNLLLNTFDFEYDIPLHVDRPKYRTIYDQIKEWLNVIKPKLQTNKENINEYYNTVEAEVVELSMRYMDHHNEHLDQYCIGSFPILEHIKLCNSIVRPISTFKDKLAELYFNPDELHFLLYGEMAGTPTFGSTINIYIAEMSYMERCKFVQMFVRNFHRHFIDYFSQISIRFNQIYQVLSLQCPSLRKFKHSCTPNIDIVMLENGIIMGRTLRSIKKGEELVVSYKAHYIRHTREDRRSFLNQINIYCECKACKGSAENEPTDFLLGIYCQSCTGYEITPSQVNCTNCGINYSTLLLKYRMEMMMLEDVVKGLINPETDERRFYLLNTIIYLRAKNYFIPANETRVKYELKYARYLALKNFVQQAYSILMEVKSNISQHYREDDLWFSFYSEMLLIIKIILYYNLDKNFNQVPIFQLEELCKFGIHIINGQLTQICLIKKYICQYTEVYEEMQLFLKWKKRIHYISLLHIIPNSEGNKIMESEKEDLPGLIKLVI